MYEVVEYYQGLAEKFDSRVVCVPALAVIIVGLCIWLAGLRWRKVLGATAGGTLFSTAAFCLGDYGLMIVIITIIGIILGALIEKVMLGIFGVVMTCVIVLITVSAFAEVQNPPPHPRWPQYEQAGVVIGFDQIIEITRASVSYMTLNVIASLKSASLVLYAAAVFAVIAAGFLAVIMPRLFIAVISSSFGSAVIYAGMLMLLFYKGSKPLDCISRQGGFCALIILVMLVFGTAVQLLLSPPVAQEAQKSPPPKKRMLKEGVE